MLKYKIKLSNEAIKQDEMVWGEKYLSPSLSFVSGVTDQTYHLEKFNKLAVTNNLLTNPNSILLLESENVLRQGYVIIYGKIYNVYSGETFDYSVDPNGVKIEYKYINVNGKYYYLKDGKYTVDHWLVAHGDEVTEETIEINELASSTSSVTANTIVWIENGKVNIDGNEYIYDFELDGLKYFEDGEILLGREITKCRAMTCHLFSDSNKYLDKTKFILRKDSEIIEEFDNITYAKYFYYVSYKEKTLPIKLSGTTFICEIPSGLINGDDDLEPIIYNVYEVGDDGSVSDIPLSGSTFETLNNVGSCVKIEGEIFRIERDVINANDGRNIAIYLKNEATNISVGDKVRIVDTVNPTTLEVYSPSDYDFNEDDDKQFVIFNGEKHNLEENLCDRVVIDGYEHDIVSADSTNYYVYIDDEIVPMKKDGTKAMRYGKIITDPTSMSTDVSYNIVHYSGITINDIKYVAEKDADNNFYINLDRNNEHTLVVTDIIGSSLLMCEPYLSDTELPSDFELSVSKQICDDIVSNKNNVLVYGKNRVFGDNEITSSLAFQLTQNPTSSDDYYNLLDNLTIFCRSGYISVPLTLTSVNGGNPLQDDIVDRDFFEAEKDKAINPIIDMEKDVYSPKRITSNNGKYSGSDTDFDPINEIRVNFHFRTRDLKNNKNWKVYESYNDASVSGLCNWFITDYEKYKTYKGDQKDLMRASDLMGLLFFTNDDIYYQKQKVAKSFVRFSYYDSTNPQTQLLLGTSTAFVNEQMLYKKYIDNSRKGVHNFIKIEEERTPQEQSGETILKQISVDAELYNTALEISDNNRIGSDIIISNKFETESSSEGYYVYMYRNYSEKLMPREIYMKVEYNHAGLGITIPFLVPMKWKVNLGGDTKTPVSALTYDQLIDEGGVLLEDVYAASYIPLYAVYDFKNKEYGYVFDERYVEVEDNIAYLNLFELKIKEDDTQDVDPMTQYVATIDMNTKQFEITDKGCNQ